MNHTIQSKNPILQFLLDAKWHYARHVLLLIVLLFNFGLFSYAEVEKFATTVHVNPMAFYIGQWINMIFAIALIYINLYFLFPKYFIKNKYVHYFVGVFICGTLFFIANFATQQINIYYFGKLEKFTIKLEVVDFFTTIMYPIVFLGCTTGYKVFANWIADQEKFSELQKEKLSSELMQLKNQVNPHFLFNTLNNLHVLTKTNPDKASEVILGLSDVLRYQIYESQQDKVYLQKDIEMIEQYLELEKIRRNNITISVAKKGNFQSVQIAPLLFTNFIDNAVKHSNANHESFIRIIIKVQEKNLYFEITNSKGHTFAVEPKGGIGLMNIKKRLALLYGETHQLDIIDEKNLFTVKLNIPI